MVCFLSCLLPKGIQTSALLLLTLKHNLLLTKSGLGKHKIQSVFCLSDYVFCLILIIQQTSKQTSLILKNCHSSTKAYTSNTVIFGSKILYHLCFILTYKQTKTNVTPKKKHPPSIYHQTHLHLRYKALLFIFCFKASMVSWKKNKKCSVQTQPCLSFISFHKVAGLRLEHLTFVQEPQVMPLCHPAAEG